ncbi:hypothetical protein [Snuella lapsa]|uniref:NVEALA family protein n=1 Tax=Snuella lapsa TaxID=870481 RepID=A0ABP6X3M4_9FLAO
MNLKKKIISTIGIAVMAMAMFFSINTVNSSNGDLDLVSLIGINTANAEEGASYTYCRCHSDGICYQGSLISFRKKCAVLDGSGWQDCMDYSNNCPL